MMRTYSTPTRSLSPHQNGRLVPSLIALALVVALLVIEYALDWPVHLRGEAR
ncbi:hypothetical protein [Roseomonas chloroacetimidivorans]|uniref:hypothetical protein n=1 Tax=Roseomonas chloroacetimidivorans TaxID=1766656 RepID=UPI003C77414E